MVNTYNENRCCDTVTVHPFLASYCPPCCTTNGTSISFLSMEPREAAGTKRYPWIAGVSSLACMRVLACALCCHPASPKYCLQTSCLCGYSVCGNSMPVDAAWGLCVDGYSRPVGPVCGYSRPVDAAWGLGVPTHSSCLHFLAKHFSAQSYISEEYMEGGRLRLALHLSHP